MQGSPGLRVLVSVSILGLVSGIDRAPLRTPVQPALQPFPLSAVTLTPETQEAEAAELNAEYLRLIVPDSLLWTFRQNAGLPTPGIPFWRVRYLDCHDPCLWSKKQGRTPAGTCVLYSPR